MPRSELARLLLSDHSRVYVLRSSGNEPLGLCEFEHHGSDIELKNFGLVPAAQGRRLGPWLLGTALEREWSLGPRRIWLHTDDWDHPAALPLYERAGFRLFDVRDEPPGDL
jgi:GNAT superfamily N-acetyltransferase